MRNNPHSQLNRWFGAAALGIALLSGFPAGAATHTVSVGPGNIFNPASVTALPGDTVRWNFLEALHSTTSDATTGPETWDSGVVFTSGGSFSRIFNTPGVYPYYCSVHSFPGGTMMNGVVRVDAALTILGVNPPVAPPGTRITISGANFAPGASVVFDSVPGLNVQVVGPAQIDVTVPALPPSTVVITVQNGAGDSDTVSFEITSAAAIPTFAPAGFIALIVALALSGWFALRNG